MVVQRHDCAPAAKDRVGALSLLNVFTAMMHCNAIRSIESFMFRSLLSLRVKLGRLLILFLVATGNGSSAQKESKVSLTVSSSYHMILSPIFLELKPKALRVVEEATAEHLRESMSSEQVQSQPIAAIDIVIQRSEFLPELLATRIQFFLLATVEYAVSEETSVGDDSKMVEADLNRTIEQAFDTDSKRERYLAIIRAKTAALVGSDTAISSQLQALDTVLVASVLIEAAPPPEVEIANSSNANTKANTKKLSTLDITLIVVSAAILIAIVVLIIQQNWDRAYIENQRLQVLNSRTLSFPHGHNEDESNFDDETLVSQNANNISTESRVGPNGSLVYLSDWPSMSTVSESMVPDFSFSAADSTELHSTAASAGAPDLAYVSEQRAPAVHPAAIGRRVLHVNTRLAPPFSIAEEKDDFTNSSEGTSLSESFESNWFRKSSLSRNVRKSTGNDSANDSDRLKLDDNSSNEPTARRRTAGRQDGLNACASRPTAEASRRKNRGPRSGRAAYEGLSARNDVASIARKAPDRGIARGG